MKKKIWQYAILVLTIVALTMPVTADQAEYLSLDGGTISGNLKVLSRLGLGLNGAPTVRLSISDETAPNLSFMNFIQHGSLSDRRAGLSLKSYDSVTESGSPWHSWYLWSLNNFTGLNGLAIGEYNEATGDGVACNGSPGDLCLKHRLFFENLTGNIGIGTTSPEAKLHVVGDVIIEGEVIADEFVPTYQ